MNRAKWLMEKVIKAGVKTKVLMLSATPVNNALRDLRNQIAFITEGKDDVLCETTQIENITQTVKNAKRSLFNPTSCVIIGNPCGYGVVSGCCQEETPDSTESPVNRKWWQEFPPATLDLFQWFLPFQNIRVQIANLTRR